MRHASLYQGTSQVVQSKRPVMRPDTRTRSDGDRSQCRVSPPSTSFSLPSLRWESYLTYSSLPLLGGELPHILPFPLLGGELPLILSLSGGELPHIFLSSLYCRSTP